MTGVLILGSGMAGYTLAKEIRKLNQEMALTIITRDDGVSYSKPMLSNALAKSMQPEALQSATAERMAEQLDATIHCHHNVVRIDADAKVVITDQQHFPYAKLVIALGANQADPGIENPDAFPQFSINNLDDYRHFRQALTSVQQVAIVGTGLIGCEFANDLLSAKVVPTIVGPGRSPLARLLPEEMGNAYQQALAKVGIQWHLGARATRLEASGAGAELVLDDGQRLSTQLLLSAVGLRPHTELAVAMGVRVNRGIEVDDYLQTNVPDVYALGDCAEIQGQVLPFILPIMHSARALAKTLVGQPTPVGFPLMPVVVKTPACPLVVLPPSQHSGGEWRTESVPDGMRAEFVDHQGGLAGFALLGSATAERQLLLKRMA